MIPTVLWRLFDFLSLKNYVNVPPKRNKQKIFFFQISFLLAFWRLMMKIAGSRSTIQRHGSADPDPHQNDLCSGGLHGEGWGTKPHHGNLPEDGHLHRLQNGWIVQYWTQWSLFRGSHWRQRRLGNQVPSWQHFSKWPPSQTTKLQDCPKLDRM